MTTHHTSGAADLLYLLRRLLSNQFTFTAPEFRKELQKIVEDAALAAGQAVAPAEPDPTPGTHPPPCDSELFESGVSVGLFDIPKWTAEALCKGIAAATGARVDWHYIAGRVHVKALPAPPAMDGGEDAEELRLLRALAFSVERAIGNGVMPLDIEEAYEGYDKWSAARAAQKEE